MKLALKHLEEIAGFVKVMECIPGPSEALVGDLNTPGSASHERAGSLAKRLKTNKLKRNHRKQ